LQIFAGSSDEKFVLEAAYLYMFSGWYFAILDYCYVNSALGKSKLFNPKRIERKKQNEKKTAEKNRDIIRIRLIKFSVDIKE